MSVSLSTGSTEYSDNYGDIAIAKGYIPSVRAAASFTLTARARTPHLERNGIALADCAQCAESSPTVRDTMPVRRDCR
jgi:hypothetical protein